MLVYAAKKIFLLNIMCGISLFENSKSCPSSKDAICQHFRHFSFLLSTSCILGFHQCSSLNTATPHFYPFQFSGIKYLPPCLCAGVWIWPNTLLQRRRFWKKYSRARQQCSDQIHSWEYWEATGELWFGIATMFPLYNWAVGRFFFFVQVDFFQTASSAVDGWQEEGRLMSKFAPPPLYFGAYPIGIKLHEGRLKKRQILGAPLPKSANRWE